MSAFVLDTSVAAAWYYPEAFSAQARAYRDRLLDGSIHLLVPTLHYWEFANVARTYLQRREITEELAREIYEVHLDAPLEVVEPDRRAVLSAALEYGATAYDAVYIALALEHELPLLTAERTTTPWVVKLGRRVRSVRRVAADR